MSEYTAATALALRGLASDKVWSRPNNADSQRTNYYKEEEDRLSWGVDQAVSRGLIDPLEAEEAKASNQRTWWDRTWGFKESSRNMMGGVAQPLIDVLSLGNYAMAATTKATLNDPLIDTGSLKLGFTPSAWYKNFKDRPYYSDMTDSFTQGLAFDIALDPMTYLTFGTGPGVRIGIGGLAKVGNTVVKEGTRKLRLTRHGKDIYNLAARRFAPQVEAMIKKDSDDAVAKGLKETRFLAPAKMSALHNDIGKYMVEHYDQLALDHMKQSTRWNQLKTQLSGGLAEAGDSLVNAVRAGDSGTFSKQAEDMFQETARAGHKEYGIGDVGRLAKGVDDRFGGHVVPQLERAFKAVAPRFHRKFNVPQDVRDVWTMTKNEIERQTAKRIGEINEKLGGLSHGELNLVTDILEAGDESISRLFDEGQDRMLTVFAKDGTNIDDHVMEAAEYARGRFDEIIKRENEAGHKIETVKDYVHRVYKTRDSRTYVLNRIEADEIAPTMTARSGFQFHRVVSSLEDRLEMMGSNSLEMNVGAILSKRERASVRMIEMEKFYDYIKLTAGITPLMVYQAGNEGKWLASTLKKLFKSQRPKDSRMHDYGQYYSMPETHGKKLGFTLDTDDFKKGGAERNMGLLEFIALPFEQRIGPAGAQLAKTTRPNSIAKASRDFSRGFKYGNKDYDIIDLLRAEYATEDVGGGIFEVAVSNLGKDGEITTQQLGIFLNRMDRHMRKELDTPLLMMFPDIMDRMKKAAAQTSKLGKKAKGGKRTTRVKGGKDILHNIEHGVNGKGGLRRPVSTHGSFVPQLPEEMVLRAKLIQMNYGDFSSIGKAANHQLNRIDELSKKLSGDYIRKKGQAPVARRMRPEHMAEISHALVGQKDITKLTGREASKLIDFMLMHTGQAPKGHLWSSSARKVIFGQRSRPFFEKADDAVTQSIKAAEEMALKDTKKINFTKEIDSEIGAVRNIMRTTKSRMKNIQKRLAKLAGRDSKEAAETTAKLTDELAAAKTDLERNQELIDLKTSQRDAVWSQREAPTLADDKRTHVSTDEVIERNKVLDPKSSNFSETEKKIIQRRKGFSKQKLSISKLIGKEAWEPAKEAQKAVNKKTAKLREQVEDLEARRDAVVDGSSELGVKLTTEIAEINKEIRKITNKVSKSFMSQVKILSGGRYLDEGGKVRDILVRKGDGDKLHIMGNDAQKVRKALLQHAVENGAKTTEFLSPALVKDLPETIVGANAGSYWLPDDVARFLEDIVTPMYDPKADPLTNFILKGYDRIQNLFKVPLLAPWGATMARNGVGNVSLAYLRAGVSLLSPEHFSDYYRTLMYTWYSESPTMRRMYLGARGKAGEAKMAKLGQQKVKYMGEDGVSMTVAELKDELGKRGVLTAWMRDEVFDTEPSKVLGQKIGGSAAGAVIGGSLGGPGGALVGAAAGMLLKGEAFKMNSLFRFQELGSEIPTRLMLGIHTFKQTGSLDEAGRVVRNFLHDYSELSTFERRVMRRAIPFYNFTKLAYRVFGTEVFENPGRVMLPWKAFNAQNLTGAMFDQPAMPEDVPDWFHKQMVLMGKNIDEESGSVKSWVYAGFNLPVQEVLSLTDIIAPGGEPISKMGSRTTFLATSVVEYMTNYDSFRGGPIYPNISAGIKKTQFESGTPFKGAPEWQQKLVGYHVGEDGKHRVDPRIAWVLGEIPTSRFINVSKKLWEMEAEEAKGLNTMHLAAQLHGVSAYRYDAQSQQYFKNRRKVEALSTLLSNIQHLKSYDISRATFKKPREQKRRAGPLDQLASGLAGRGPL